MKFLAKIIKSIDS